MNKIVTSLNKPWLVAIVTGLFVLSFARRFVGR